jgi:hypothetical protein
MTEGAKAKVVDRSYLSMLTFIAGLRSTSILLSYSSISSLRLVVEKTGRLAFCISPVGG